MGICLVGVYGLSVDIDWCGRVVVFFCFVVFVGVGILFCEYVVILNIGKMGEGWK